MGKLSIDEFRKIKLELHELIERLDGISKNNDLEEQLLNEYFERQKQLLSHDLSDIPFEEWEGMVLASLDGEGEIDLSQTHANIDLDLIEFEGKRIILGGCNVRNIEESLKNTPHDESSFDDEFMREHPEYFLDKSAPPEARELYYKKKITFPDLLKYPQLRKHVKDYSFQRSNSLSKKLIDAIGFEYALRFFDEYPDFVTTITDTKIKKSGYYEMTFKIDPPFDKTHSYEEAKKTIYRYIVEEIISNVTINFPPLEVIPQEMKDSIPEAFIKDGELPEELIKRYYQGELTYDDCIYNYEILRTKEIKIGTRSMNDIKTINMIFGDISKFIEQVPTEYHKLILKYFRYNKDRKIEYKDFPSFITDAINYVKRVDIPLFEYYKLEDVYAFSKYIPVEELFFDSHMIKFIQRCGFENIIKFNKENDGALDEEILPSFDRSLIEAFAEYFDKIDDGSTITNEQQLTDIFNKIIHKIRLDNTGNAKVKLIEHRRKLSKVCWKEIPNYELLDTTLKDRTKDDKREIISKLNVGFDGFTNILLELLNQEPELVPTIIDKNIIINEEYSKFYQEVGNERFLHICSKYGIAILGLEISLDDKELIAQAKSDNYEQYMNKLIYDTITDDEYDGTYDVRYMPESFKKEHPELYINDNVPKDIQDKFYTKSLEINDFLKDEKLIALFETTCIVDGFRLDYRWIKEIFSYYDNTTIGNYNCLKIMEAYSKLRSVRQKDTFKKYIKRQEKDINYSKLDVITELILRINYSNSLEIQTLQDELLDQLVDHANPLETLEEIEKIFLKNNLPLCGKMYLCFQKLYPKLDEEYDFSSKSRVAPQLKDDSLPNVGYHTNNNQKRLMIIFNDLLRISYRSNERSLVEYLENIENGNKIFLALSENKINFNNLTKEQKEILEIFVSHLELLAQNRQKNEIENKDLKSLSLEEKMNLFIKIFGPNDRYALKDRIVRSFCYFAGIKSFDELKGLIEQSKTDQVLRRKKNLKEIEANGGIFKFEEGDIVRGIGDIYNFGSTLSTGNYCKEQLGSFTGSVRHDTTPLDVDLTLVTRTDTIYHAIKDSPTGFGFGNIFVILKKDNPQISITRDKDGNLTNTPYDPKRIEVFGTTIPGTGGYETHWGARTGIAFTDVDFILYKETRMIDDDKPYDDNGNVHYTGKKSWDDLSALKFEIARNGYYIPVIDFSGKIIFTEDEFNKIRKKMVGLSHYQETSYQLSNNLITDEIIEIASEINDDSVRETNEKRKKIVNAIKKVIEEFNYSLKLQADNDLTTGSIELIDTGSTGRNTNVPHDGDFDFFMRLDNKLMSDKVLYEKFVGRLKAVIEEFELESSTFTDQGDLRFKKVKLDDKTTVDIDISFGVKTNKVTYSSDRCLADRLETIRKLYPEQYKSVVANIILAKRVLKEAEAYKPNRGDKPQGGLGGIGIENWILQNGGSFIDAAREFLSVAINENGEIRNFEDFKARYEIWDFGENYFSARKDKYKHDNFITRNMSPEGYMKMVKALVCYLKKYYKNKEETELNKTK